MWCTLCIIKRVYKCTETYNVTTTTTNTTTAAGTATATTTTTMCAERSCTSVSGRVLGSADIVILLLFRPCTEYISSGVCLRDITTSRCWLWSVVDCGVYRKLTGRWRRFCHQAASGFRMQRLHLIPPTVSWPHALASWWDTHSAST